MLEVKNLSTYYGDNQILFNVSLSIKRGEVVALIGSNGSGKTTLFKTIMGLIKPRVGSIVLDGVRIDKLPTHKIVNLGMTLVPEGRQLFPQLTVLENLLVGSTPNTSKTNMHHMLRRVFELFPVLQERKNQLAHTLSGGEQQMLAIGRGLMSNPKILLLDEPSLGLAPVLVQKLFSVIKEINQDGVTILLSEQNAFEALKIANRAYVLESGKIVKEGEANELIFDENLKKAYFGLEGE